jgi:3-hydroxyacyl-CoA dehydrogenase
VIEAIIERMADKQALFEKLEAKIGPETIIASNTSGLQISEMTKGRSESFKKRFLVMHFFNPVRYMKLLELVAAPRPIPPCSSASSASARTRSARASSREGHAELHRQPHRRARDDDDDPPDAPEGLAPEDVDAITGVAMAHPKSASFRTADVVGLDTFVHVADNCYHSLVDDEEREVFEVPAYIRTMVEKKILGDKTKGGFYRGRARTASRRSIPRRSTYRAKGGDEAIRRRRRSVRRSRSRPPREALVADQGQGRAVRAQGALRRLGLLGAPHRRDRGQRGAIDDAMRWGYNWELGPFETWDALGFVETVERMTAEGVALPASILRMKESGATSFYRADGAVFDLKRASTSRGRSTRATRRLQILRRGAAPVLKNDGAEAWDLGDGVLGITFKTKANSIDADVVDDAHPRGDRARGAGLPALSSSPTRASTSAWAPTCS